MADFGEHKAARRAIVGFGEMMIAEEEVAVEINCDLWRSEEGLDLTLRVLR